MACCKLELTRQPDAGHRHTGQLTIIFLCAGMLVMTFFFKLSLKLDVLNFALVYSTATAVAKGEINVLFLLN